MPFERTCSATTSSPLYIFPRKSQNAREKRIFFLTSPLRNLVPKARSLYVRITKCVIGTIIQAKGEWRLHCSRGTYTCWHKRKPTRSQSQDPLFAQHSKCWHASVPMTKRCLNICAVMSCPMYTRTLKIAAGMHLSSLKKSQ